MSRRLLFCLFLFPLFSTVLLSPQRSVTAQSPLVQPAPSTLVFPFVPNGEHYGDTGPWYGTVIVQNPESVSVTVEVRTADGSLSRPVTIDPQSHAVLAASQLFGACRYYRTVVRRHDPDGIDVVFLPTTTLAVDRIEIAGFQPGLDFTWQVLADELQIDWSLPGWEPSGEYVVTVVDCPDGQPLFITLLDAANALASDPTACVTRTRALEVPAVKGVLDGADAVPLPKDVGPVAVVEVRYGTRYWGSLGMGDPTALDSSGRWQATISGGAITIQWGATANDDDGTIPTGARYAVIVHRQEPLCREPRLAAMLVLTAGIPSASDGSTNGASIVSSAAATPAADLGTNAVIPLVQRHNGWTTVLHVAHRGTTVCPAHVTLRDGRGEMRWSGTRSLAPGQLWHLDVRTLGLPEEFIGSAWIQSSCGALASADRIKPSHQLGLTLVGIDPERASNQLLLPLVYSNHNGWNTGLALTNLSRGPITVDLAFHTAGGALARLERYTLAPFQQQIVYRPDLPPGLPGSGLLVPGDRQTPGSQAPQLFALQIRATGAVAVIGDTVKYTAGAGRALTLPALPTSAPGTSQLLPFIQVPHPVERSDVTGIALANASDTPAPVTIELRPPAGATPIRLSIPVAPNGLGIVYLPESLPSGTHLSGTAVVWADAGQTAAVSTQVNAAVAGDGATGTPLMPSWTTPVLAASLLLSWDAAGS
ncbi:MAG: hypothetical protein NZL87_02795, partial [Thermomicrobium sp.]|nr:hypothetical protein [Thermomicrobium sp.]